MILTKQLRFVQMMMFCDFNVLPCDKSHSYQVCFFFSPGIKRAGA